MLNFKKSENSRRASKIKINSGFALLFAVLLASFLITLGISIFSISLKEIQITTSVRDSQVAYYVADSARECALYWDVKEGASPACLDSSCASPSTSTNPNIICNGTSVTLNFKKDILTYSANQPNFFQASSTSSSTPVADIIITKTFDSDNIVTKIDARGHNTGILGRRVERGISQSHN